MTSKITINTRELIWYLKFQFPQRCSCSSSDSPSFLIYRFRIVFILFFRFAYLLSFSSVPNFPAIFPNQLQLSWANQYQEKLRELGYIDSGFYFNPNSLQSIEEFICQYLCYEKNPKFELSMVMAKHLLLPYICWNMLSKKSLLKKWATNCSRINDRFTC